MSEREQMNIVVVGHVDHGKSTVIGRLLADTNSLPQGKLEQVRELCRRTAKPFEYAFLLDALKDEQAQGITIDTARCFFKSEQRDYIIIDAPGHLEFLKNMITGAARAEAALLVIDAHEGIRENSRRHGYLLAMLGIKHVAILVNKMDLADFKPEVFASICREYREFLKQVNLEPREFIPISARDGENIMLKSARMPWYSGPTVLEQLDAFPKAAEKEQLPFRFPVQDIYKFTENQDDRRIFAGTIETGSVKAGDEVVFLPSHKKSRIQSIEGFNTPACQEIGAGWATGFTLTEQIYIRPGEMMAKAGEPQPLVGTRFRVAVFWLGRAPLIRGRKYKLKLASAHTTVQLAEVSRVLNASDLSFTTEQPQVDRHDVAECILETTKPVAFDVAQALAGTSRFVLVDHYEIAGGGIILRSDDGGESSLETHIRLREERWERGAVLESERLARFGHRSKFILFTGPPGVGKRRLAKALEQRLFQKHYLAYYLGISSLSSGLDADVASSSEDKEEQLRRLGELARILTGAGHLFITTLDHADAYDIAILQTLNTPYEILVVNVGDSADTELKADLQFQVGEDLDQSLEKICTLLQQMDVLRDYSI